MSSLEDTWLIVWRTGLVLFFNGKLGIVKRGLCWKITMEMDIIAIRK